MRVYSQNAQVNSRANFHLPSSVSWRSCQRCITHSERGKRFGCAARRDRVTQLGVSWSRGRRAVSGRAHTANSLLCARTHSNTRDFHVPRESCLQNRLGFEFVLVLAARSYYAFGITHRTSRTTRAHNYRCNWARPN